LRLWAAATAVRPSGWINLLRDTAYRASERARPHAGRPSPARWRPPGRCRLRGRQLGRLQEVARRWAASSRALARPALSLARLSWSGSSTTVPTHSS